MVLQKYNRVFSRIGVATALILMMSAPSVLAQPYASPNYKVNEAVFGAGGDVDANSANYNARGSVGALGVGDANSANYNANGGNITPSEEYLELNITAATVDLGTIDTTSTGTGNGQFYVRTYLASGYVVETMSNPPTYSGRQLAPMTAGGTSSQGTEQFGINLVANTSPTTFGTDPAPQPGSGYAFGIAATGYDTPNNYKYNVGDVIASAPKGIGQTNYTVSYLVNISPVTPAGQYSMVHDIVVVATF